MKIHAMFFTQTGKYYTDFTFEMPYIPKSFLEEFKQLFVDHQTGMIDGWQEHNFFIVTDSAEEAAPIFTTRLYMPDAFRGLRKRITKNKKEN